MNLLLVLFAGAAQAQIVTIETYSSELCVSGEAIPIQTSTANLATSSVVAFPSRVGDDITKVSFDRSDTGPTSCATIAVFYICNSTKCNVVNYKQGSNAAEGACYEATDTYFPSMVADMFPTDWAQACPFPVTPACRNKMDRAITTSFKITCRDVSSAVQANACVNKSKAQEPAAEKAENYTNILNAIAGMVGALLFGLGVCIMCWWIEKKSGKKHDGKDVALGINGNSLTGNSMI